MYKTLLPHQRYSMFSNSFCLSVDHYVVNTMFTVDEFLEVSEVPRVTPHVLAGVECQRVQMTLMDRVFQSPK